MDCPQPKCATKCATFSKTKSTVFSSQDGSTQLSTQRTPQETPHRSGLLNVRSHASPPRHDNRQAHGLPQSLAKRKYRGLCQAGNNLLTATLLILLILLTGQCTITHPLRFLRFLRFLAAMLAVIYDGKNSPNGRQLLRCFMAFYFLV